MIAKLTCYVDQLNVLRLQTTLDELTNYPRFNEIDLVFRSFFCTFARENFKHYNS